MIDWASKLLPLFDCLGYWKIDDIRVGIRGIVIQRMITTNIVAY